MTKIEIQTLYEVMFTDYPDIVNVAQVQAMLGSSRHLAYALIGDGDIPGMKIGNAYCVPKIMYADVTLREKPSHMGESLNMTGLLEGTVKIDIFERLTSHQYSTIIFLLL